MKKKSFKRIAYKLHLWLGFASGIIIFIVAFTGALYAFQTEFRDIFQPYQYVKIEDKPFLSPNELKEKSKQFIYVSRADTSNIIYGVTYGRLNKAATVAYNHHENGYTILLLNPYSGEYISEQILKDDFFRFILAGHRNLWLPYDIGHQIVGWAVLIFVVVAITGIIIWMPKKWNKKTLKPRLTFNRKANRFRRYYDLHNVLGIYTVLIALIMALTGLTWSFEWFSSSYYKLVSGGNEFNEWVMPETDTMTIVSAENVADRLWLNMVQEYPIGRQGTFMFDYPLNKSGVYRICFNSANDDTYYKRHFRFFDQNTLKELEGGGMYGIKYENSSAGDKFYRMTYDIHVGAIGGLPGKIIAFVTSLIIASLPITGLIVYFQKNKKKRKKD